MAKKTATPTKETLPPRTSALPDLAHRPIVIEDNTITIAQLFRGNQDIQQWYASVKSAEQLRTPLRYQLYNTYFDVAIDLHYEAMVGKRKRAVLNVPFEVSGIDNDVLKENFAAPWMKEFKEHAMDSIFWGPSLAEFALGDDNLIGKCELIPRQNVMPEFEVISIDGMSPTGGIPYKQGLYANYILQIGHKRHLGLLAKIAPYILMKRMNLADWSRYNEMFGHDLRVYYYDPSKPDAKAKVEQSAKQYGSAAYIVLPKAFAEVDFKASNKQSSAAMYKELHDILNDEITIGIVGQLLTTGGKTGGSFSLGKVHQDVEEGINMEDRMMFEYLFNYPFKKNILIPHGYPLKPENKGQFKLTEEVSIEVKQQMWMNMIDRGFPIATEDIQTEFGISAPGDKPIFVKVQAPNPFGGGAPPDPNADPNTNADPNPSPSGEGQGVRSQPGGTGKKKLSGLSHNFTRLSALYAHTCPDCGGNLTMRANSRGVITLGYKSDLNSLIDDFIDKVKSGELTPGKVDEDLYELIGSRLYDAVEKGYGTTLEIGTATEQNALLALRDNVYRFSAFKNYHLVIEANALLKNADGTLKGYDQFKKDVLALSNDYNVNYLRTEYNHARAVSRMSAKWQDIKKDAGTLPLLQYVTVGDSRVRVSHAALNGITRPVDDQFWKSPNSHLPPLAYNCRCTVAQLADGEQTLINSNDLPAVQKGFGYNWGEEKFVFPPDHPQFDVEPGDQSLADNNFGMTPP